MANRQNLVRREAARRCPIAWLLVALIAATVLQLRGSLSAEKAFVNVVGKGGVSRYAGTRTVGVVRHAEEDDDDDEEYEFQGGTTLLSVADAVPGMAYTGTVTGIAKFRGGSPKAGQELGVNVDLGLGKDVLVIKNKAVSGRADEIVLENTFKKGTVVKVWACPRTDADLEKDIYPFSLVPNKVFPTRRDTPVSKFQELVGQQVMGFVSGSAAFGAFVVIKNKEGEFGQGLLPAKLGGDALEVGSVTKVKVLSIDVDKNQLTLCIREPAPRAGDTAPPPAEAAEPEPVSATG